MDYLKTVVPSQLIAERGSNLVVINPGSSNVRIGFAHQQVPFNIPHCIARHVKEQNEGPKKTVQDQLLNSEAIPAQQLEREKAYDIIASLLKIPFLDEEAAHNSYPLKMGRVDAYPPHQGKSDTTFTWTDVREKTPSSTLAAVGDSAEKLENKGAEEESLVCKTDNVREASSEEYTFKEFVCGEEALRISSSEPYCLSRPIRRGHFNVSEHYPLQQVFEDLYTIWSWLLIEKLHIPPADRNLYSAILVVPETFDNREIKEMLSIVLRDLRFSSAVVHQEGLAAAFGNGLSTACVVNMGAQVTSVICIEDGVALPSTCVTLPYGGEDISRCLLWVQRHHQTWPPIHTNPLVKPIDMLMLNKIKESYCQIREGEFDAVAAVHSYEEDRPVGSHKTRLSALNVPPMGLFYPTLFVPEEYPPPPRSWFHDYEDMLEDSLEFPRRPDMSDGLYLGVNGGLNMWDSYPVFPTRLKKDEKLGLAEAITSSILSTGRLDLQRKLFCSIQLIGGVAMTSGLVAAVEERVLHAIPSNEAIDTVEVLQSRSDPLFVSWKGGAILAILDFARDAWIHREDWIRNGIHVGSGRKYKDSYFLQAQAMCYINS
ncbi:actin-related protein 9 [Elaeis guineensis]|uniref:Actin-related protein 9 n=1 Tax=Elaeis guineensis var. tenera TaxID=51953 RepID=A0A6I9Q886_ELAGV|nr:actin-related protein 9 [Elaeis guineensis]XP_010904572.1 actin-related protein 9 [Elaeis guineensis]